MKMAKHDEKLKIIDIKKENAKLKEKIIQIKKNIHKAIYQNSTKSSDG